jgi:hypothetical protein
MISETIIFVGDLTWIWLYLLELCDFIIDIICFMQFTVLTALIMHIFFKYIPVPSGRKNQIQPATH